MIIQGYVFSILYVLLCVAGAVVLHKLGVPKKYTRKFVHIFVGFEWVILNHFMGGGIHFLAVCILFTILLAIDYKVKLLPAMSSDGDNAPGTVYYAVAMTVLASITIIIPQMMMPFGVAVFCTSLGDGLAGVFGQAVKKHNPRIYGSKSLIGTLTNLAVCFSVPLVIGSVYSYPISVWQAAIIAIFAAEMELFVGRGLDNIVLTLSVAFLTFGLVNFTWIVDYILPILLTPAIIALSYTKKALTVAGIVTALGMDIIISLALGNFGFSVLAFFFVGSVVIDKIKKHGKKAGQSENKDVEKRGDCRSTVQVLANGGVATVAAIAFLLTGNQAFVIAFVASLAEAFADTVASGVGSFASGAYDVFHMRPCVKGISGGMSVIGTLASLVSAFSVALVAFAFGRIGVKSVLIIGLFGFLGGVFDSMLGSLAQIKYKCTVCGSVTEKEEHCGKKCERFSGIVFVDNDFVNLMGTVFAAVLAAVLYLII